MKFLIAGYGSIGRRHLRNLLALGEQDILLYRTHHSTLPDQDEASRFQVITNLDDAFSARPDAVIISNPTALHLDVAIPAAEMGCAILLEKPVSHTLERVDDLHAAVQRGGGPLLVGFQLRYHPTLKKAARMITDGAIGTPAFARAHWGEYLPNWHPWEDYRKGYAARPD
ncbi:MAG TPA: Gfo/Idh/MocA family oxidoreductase, partial [Levilinea sp.]|nr:Gfo/Idh/MocA family oxidoreductase [Levilinea sp.]